MIRVHLSITEEQLQRLRRQAQQRCVSVAVIIREAIDRVTLDEEIERSAGIDALLAVAGSAASGTGGVATNHDAVLGEGRW